MFFSSPEHEVLGVSYCDRAVSVVRRSFVRRPSSTFCLVRIFSPITMKLCKNIWLGEISDEFEHRSWVKNEVTKSNIRKPLCML